MRQNNYIDPMMIVVYQRQDEFLKEAAYDHLASHAKLLAYEGRAPRRKKLSPGITIWRKTAWSLGKAAFSLGIWLLAR